MSRLTIKISIMREGQLLEEQVKEIDGSILDIRNGNFQVEHAINALGQQVTKQVFLKHKK